MALRPLQETIDESLSNLRNPDGLSPFLETPDGQIIPYASEEEKEYRPLEEIEPKWWHLREQLRKVLINSGVPRYRVRELIGKNAEEFQRMSELREEAGLEPMGMLEGMTQGLGTLDAALGITSLPAFTKTMGQMALPYAAMGTEATAAFTDNLKAIQEEPEDQPKDFGYYMRRAGLPLAGAAGLMGFSRFVPKTDVSPTLPSQQTAITDLGQVRDENQLYELADEMMPGVPLRDPVKEGGFDNYDDYFQDMVNKRQYTLLNEERGELGTNPDMYWWSKEKGDPVDMQMADGTYTKSEFFDLPKADIVDIDQTRRNILKTGAIGAGLASLPRPLTSVVKYGSKAPVVPAAAGKEFLQMFGTNLAKPNIKDQLTNSLEEYVVGAPDYTDFAAQYERFPDGTKLGNRAYEEAVQRSNEEFQKSMPFLEKFGDTPDEVNIKVLIDDDFNVTSTFKDLKKESRAQAFGEETIHRHLADQANIIEIEAIGHTGQKHFKNYGLKPDEVNIIYDANFDGFYPNKDFTDSFGDKVKYDERWEGTPIGMDYGTPYDMSDFIQYVNQHGRKINKEVDPGIPYEAGDMGFVGINYYEIDGVPVAVGNYTAREGGQYTEAIIIPNDDGLKKLLDMTDEEYMTFYERSLEL